VISRGSALERVIGFGGHAAVVFGSGLAGLPRGARVEVELGYSELGWPCTDVPGHANLLRLVSVPMPVRETRSPAARESPAAVVGTPATAPGARLRLVLACGRPHHYEGWSRAELGRPVADLAAAGVRRLVLTNSCGALCPAVVPGDMISCHEVVDLQAPPRSGEPERLRVCDEAEALAVGAVVRRVVAADASSRVAVDSRSGAPASAGAGPRRTHAGVYVAVPGPQFETPAEVRWLARRGEVVGMSAAPELRAAHAAGASCCLLGLVANRAAAVGSHEDVLAVGGSLASGLAAALPAAVLARWPGIGGRRT
jgi:purine nucleoside phosphorylase